MKEFFTSRRKNSAGALTLGAVGLAAAAALLRIWTMDAVAENIPVAIPPAAYSPPALQTTETAILSGGCFWALQGVFEHVRGVTKVYAGYTGGSASTAHYEIVSTGATGHAESVQIMFDPKVISYAKILQIYFSVTTDPTELNYQGPDSGSQYRSEIWYTSSTQKSIATAYITQLGNAHTFSSPIVTKIDAAMPFYQAESYHQDFLVRNPDYPYIAINDIPKVTALQTLYSSLYRQTPVTVSPVS